MERREVREPAVAGSFYPGDARSLNAIVESMIASVRPKSLKSRPVALVVPHAGYPYSGQTAAHAYRSAKGQDYDTVVLVGPSHHSLFRGAAVYTGGDWRTPLGDVPVENSVASRIIESCPIASDAPSAHAEEHSLEVQIPFIQKALEKCKIVPILVSSGSASDADSLSKAIVDATSDKRSLLVASSDLYHGYSYEECVKNTAATIKGIEEGDPKKLEESFETGESSACGEGAILTALSTARRLGASPHLLHQTNSADVTGMRSGYVVGYCSFAFV